MANGDGTARFDEAKVVQLVELIKERMAAGDETLLAALGPAMSSSANPSGEVQSIRSADGESGAVGGIDPLDRVNRLHFMLDGLASLMHIFEAAQQAPDHLQFTEKVWSPAYYLTSMLARDAHHEVSALWDGVRPLLHRKPQAA